jgi:hypothetical protein
LAISYQPSEISAREMLTSSSDQRLQLLSAAGFLFGLFIRFDLFLIRGSL